MSVRPGWHAAAVEPGDLGKRRTDMAISLRRSALVVAAAVAGIAGCSGGSAAADHRSSPAVTATNASPAYAAQAQARTRLATAFARRIAAVVPPHLVGEKTLATAPARLAEPDEVIGADDLITEARYWIVSGPPLRVYRALKHSPSRYRLTGWGAPGAGSNPPHRAFLSYDSVPAPAYIQDDEVHVEIARHGTGRSVIASFAEVDTHPVRMAVETIAAAGSSGGYTWPRIDAGKVVGHVSATLAPARVRALVRWFDGSPVANSPDACFGALRLAGDVLTVRISSGGHAWKLAYPGTSCGDISVSRDGHPLDAIRPSATLRHRLEVLAHDDGTVVGRLLEVGGVSVSSSPEPGKVAVTAHGHSVATVHPGRDGHFAIEVPPGRYTVVGSTPRYLINGGRGRCAAAHMVRVRTGVTVHADVYCVRR